MRVITRSKVGSAICSVFCLSFLIMCSAIIMLADVTSLSGTFSSTFGQVHDGSSVFVSNIQLQGTNFSLTGNLTCYALQSVSQGSGDFISIVNPNITVPAAAPMDEPCRGLSVDSMQLVYNGQTYTNVRISLDFTGLEATTYNYVPGVIPPNALFTNLSGMAFTMTGVVTAYSNGSGETGPTGSVLVSIPISGSGTFQVSQESSLYGGGGSGTSNFQFDPSPAAFSAETDATGTWSGAYGGDGYLIANGPSYLPGYAAVSVTQASPYTWASMTNDPRALQDGVQAASRIASAYTGNANINIDFTDSNLHRVSLYLLDFDTNTRSETLTVTDANTGAVLDQQVVSNFHNGVYANFDLKGNVVIHVTSNSAASAVVSGVFFGPSNSPVVPAPAVASSVEAFGEDGTPQGAWPTQFGTSGYIIANGPSSAPTNATFSVNGATTYTWAASTTDPRALRTGPNSTTGIASAYTQYAGTPFSINIYADPIQEEQIALYLLDWDNAGRSETITISDLSTGTVLDTLTVSNFQNGVYLIYYITGNVVVNVQPNGNTAAVISGIFFN